jgi:hypothetical protein
MDASLGSQYDLRAISSKSNCNAAIKIVTNRAKSRSAKEKRKSATRMIPSGDIS